MCVPFLRKSMFTTCVNYLVWWYHPSMPLHNTGARTSACLVTSYCWVYFSLMERFGRFSIFCYQTRRFPAQVRKTKTGYSTNYIHHRLHRRPHRRSIEHYFNHYSCNRSILEPGLHSAGYYAAR